MKFNNVIFILATIFITACSTYDSGRSTMPNSLESSTLGNRFTLPQRVAPPANIQSLQLYAEGNETMPPVIKLGKSTLTLEFDYMQPDARQFQIRISHRSRNWEESPLPPNAYLGTFFETIFSDGQRSFTQNPAYRHYSYTFPNNRIQITKSGNYLLSVYDYSSDKLLFRIPFFVTEDAGRLNTRIEELFTQRDDGRTVAQPSSVYHYPNFVQQPQFDLSFFYVQNQFWGRMRSTDLFDTATPGEVHFRLSREQSFLSNYEFNVLDLRSFEASGQSIIEIQPQQTPPVITLRRDVQSFSNALSRYPNIVSGIPSDDRDAEYGEVIFSLETDKSISPSDEIYLVGDFNEWMIEKSHRMQYDSTRRLWQGRALIKQGIYKYKYVTLKNSQIDDLALDRSFTDARPSYLTFIYFQDPQRQFDRLLQVHRLIDR